MLRFLRSNLDFQRTSNKLLKFYSRRETHKVSFERQIFEYFTKSIESRLKLRENEVSTQIRAKLMKTDETKQKLLSIFDSLSTTSLRIKKLEKKIRLENYELFKKEIHELDSKCCLIMTSLDQLEILYLLLNLFETFATRIVEFQFYEKSLNHLIKMTEYGLMSGFEIAQLLFFIAITKKDATEQICSLKPMLPNLRYFTLMDRCIVALAFFKTSSKLPRYQLESIEDAIEREPEALAKDPLLLVSMCKAVRLSGPSPGLTLKNLSSEVMGRMDQVEFGTLTNILSLYAEALIFEKDVLDYFVVNCIKTMKDDRGTHSLRLKDVDRFLWSISRLNYIPKLEERKFLTEYSKSRYEQFTKKRFLEHFLRSIVSLLMLQCEDLEPLIKQCFDQKVFVPISQDTNDWKMRTLLQLLVSLAKLEMNITAPHQLQKKIELSFTPSENLMMMKQIGLNMIDRGLVETVAIECPIKSIVIPGLTLVTERRPLHVDVLDESTCLKNTLRPYGFMQLKLRMIPHLGYHHVLINGNTLSCVKKTESLLMEKVKEVLAEKRSS